MSLLIGGMFLASPGAANAVPKVSISSGKWSQAARWSPSGAPAAGDDVTIAAGTTIDFDTQAPATSTVLSLTIQGGGTLNFNDNSPNTLTVTGSVTNGGSMVAGGPGNRVHTLEVGGDFSNNGTFASVSAGGDSIDVTCNGSTAQTISGLSSTVFNALTIANTGAGTTNLTASASVGAVLTLTSDLTVTSPAILTQSGTSAGTADVVGTVQRSDVGATPRAFGNPNVQVTNGTAMTLKVLLVKSAPGSFPTAVKRTYTLTVVSGTVTSATLRYHYLNADLNGNTAASLDLYRAQGSPSVWVDNGTTGVTRTTGSEPNNFIQQTGITGFSSWTLANGGQAPTDIAMVGYAATNKADGKVLLQWETGREVNNLGFNLYREEAGQRVRINKSLIAGSGLMASPGTVMSAGRSYAWQTSASRGEPTVYWIEEFDISGRTVWHGPIASSSAPAGKAMMSAREQAIADQTVTLSDMAAESALNGVTRPVETLANTARSGGFKIAGAIVAPQPPTKQVNPAVKIGVKQEGWYRVTQPQLVAAGLNPNSNPASLQLFADGVEVPISVNSNNGAFDATSSIEFYGLAVDTPSTDTHVYTLAVGGAGKRIQSVTGPGGLPSSDSFLYAVERRDRSIYVSGVHNGDAENFFGSVVSSSPINQALTLTNVDATAAGQATIEVGMQGLSLTPHVVTVNLNGNPIGTISYDGQAQGVAQFTVASSSLLEGQNIVTLSGAPGVTDVSLVDHIRVSYWHVYAADSNAVRFTASQNQQIALSGFTTSAVNVFDVTDPNNPTRVAATVTEQKSSPNFLVTVAVPGTGTRMLAAIGDDQTRTPFTLVADTPSTWRSKSNAADLVIITSNDLKNSLKPLQTLRQTQGLKVAMVDVEDLYDEFSFSNKSPQAIKDFLAYAKANWKVAPKYVLLAGSASYDPKNYNGFGAYDVVPTKLIDTSFSETASDDWFADFNQDGIPEMSVGRLPVPTSNEAATTVTKILVYENSQTFNSSLLVADGNLDFDFEAANASLAALFPGSITTQQINRGQLGTAAAQQQLLDGIASGQKIVNYVGHGSPSVWRDNLLTAADALTLTNTGRYPLFIAMTCLNGEFQHPELNSLAVALMNSRAGGAIAVWASSGFTMPAEQAVMNQQFYTLLFPSNKPVNGKITQAAMTLGDITTSAKQSVSDPDIRRTWILFGDPSMKLK